MIAAELRPPRAELGSREGMDAWIDTVPCRSQPCATRCTRLPDDSAVGTQEENNLRHLVTNLGRDVAHDHVVPFLTSKHSVEFCLSYAEQAWQHGFPSLVVLGGDKRVGRPRCVEHAWQLRAADSRARAAADAGRMGEPVCRRRAASRIPDRRCFNAEYYLTQIVSHWILRPVERFVEQTRRSRISKPGMFGVFYYRSANPKTLER